MKIHSRYGILGEWVNHTGEAAKSSSDIVPYIYFMVVTRDRFSNWLQVWEKCWFSFFNGQWLETRGGEGSQYGVNLCFFVYKSVYSNVFLASCYLFGLHNSSAVLDTSDLMSKTRSPHLPRIVEWEVTRCHSGLLLCYAGREWLLCGLLDVIPVALSLRENFFQATVSPVMPNFFVDLFSEVNKQLKEADGCATEDNYFCFFVFKLQ